MSSEIKEFLFVFIRDIYHFIINLRNNLTFKIRFRKSSIIKPLEIKFTNISNIYISENVIMNHNIILRILDKCKLYIGKNTYIGSHCHIAGTKNKIMIGENVLIADKVFITTVNYIYTDVNKPIMFQGFSSKGDVIINDECWIGINSSILSGVTIGKHSIIGANSVVTHDIPPFSVAVGNPAHVIKKYCFKSKKWVRVNSS